MRRYHKQTSQLQLKISDQTLRVEGQQKEILSQRQHQGELEAQMKRFRVDLHECVQFIQDPKNLKEAVKKIHAKYVGEMSRKAEVDTDIQQEYNRQRDYLEKTVDGLKRKLSKDMCVCHCASGVFATLRALFALRDVRSSCWRSE